MFEISDPILYRAGVQELRRGCPSPKAMMSFRDADLVEGALQAAFSVTAPRAPRILEWGCGLSTLYYTRALAERGESLWVTLEYDRAFFEQRVAPYLTLWSDVQVVKVSSAAELEAAVADGLPARGIVALVFDAGSLTPAQNEPDRHADLDAYVDAPALRHVVRRGHGGRQEASQVSDRGCAAGRRGWRGAAARCSPELLPRCVLGVRSVASGWR